LPEWRGRGNDRKRFHGEENRYGFSQKKVLGTQGSGTGLENQFIESGRGEPEVVVIVPIDERFDAVIGIEAVLRIDAERHCATRIGLPEEHRTGSVDFLQLQAQPPIEEISGESF